MNHIMTIRDENILKFVSISLGHNFMNANVACAIDPSVKWLSNYFYLPKPIFVI